jgi:hypothetical protein
MGMGHDNGLGRRVLAVAAATSAMVLAMTGVALADTASISVTATSGESDPAAEVPRTFTITGNTGSPKQYFVKYRPTGGAPCASSAYADSGNSIGAWYGESANGDFRNSYAATWQNPGSYLFCIWLASNSSQVVTPISQTISFRSPTGTISATLNPASPVPGQQATVTVSGASEAPKEVFATVRGAGAPCAPTRYADSGNSLIGGDRVNGSFSIQATMTQQTAGNYVICLWLADGPTDASPVAGPQAVPFTVAAPPAPPPPPCLVPSIVRGTTLGSAKRKLKVAHCSLGPVTRRYSSVRTGRVIRSTPTAGAQLATGSPVAIVVSKGRKRRRR